MILVDTSVWVSHIRQADGGLTRLLSERQVFLHPFVIGELACGNLPNRKQTLYEFTWLQSASLATQDEVLEMIEVHKLHGRGVGWADVNILASALLHDCPLWTLDNALREAAKTVGVKVHTPTVH
ncbi:MAG: PIN domain-containing protein [Bryobacteraceae bacterium]|jgi:predicted nucleic acid-binding protein